MNSFSRIVFRHYPSLSHLSLASHHYSSYWQRCYEPRMYSSTSLTAQSIADWRKSRIRRRLRPKEIRALEPSPSTSLSSPSSTTNESIVQVPTTAMFHATESTAGDASDFMYGYYGPSRRRQRLYGGGPEDLELMQGSSSSSSKIKARVRVRSVHIAQTIDVAAAYTLFSNESASMKLVPDVRHQFGKTGVVLELPPPGVMVIEPTPEASNTSPTITSNTAINPATKQPRFVAIYRFGSVVFFNVPSKESTQILQEIKKHALNTNLSPGFEKKETFEVAISPDMDASHQYVTGDFVTVKELNLDSVQVIANIMAQTVALDSYSDTTDTLLEKFATINSCVYKTGNFTTMERDALFKVIAQNNSILIDMIGKLGIKDRSDTAWNLTQYDHVHQGMKYEFEIDDRFEQIEFKLNLIAENAKFFLEILHNQKSNTLEWIIIVLITFECALMSLDMSGLGASLLSNS